MATLSATIRKREEQRVEAQRAAERKRHESELAALQMNVDKLAQQKAAQLSKKGLRQQDTTILSLRKQLEAKSKQLAKAEKEATDHKRRLESVSASARGQQAEVALLALLQQTCKDDLFEGNRSDILQTITDNKTGDVIARILYESKDTLSFSKSWITKAAKDARRHGSAHSVIVTETMPPGLKHYAVINGVHVLHVAHVAAWAPLFRAMLCSVHRTGAAQPNLSVRLERLYLYMESKDFERHLRTISNEAQSIAEQITKEQAMHEKQWGARRVGVEKILGAQYVIHTEVANLLGGRDANDDDDLIKLQN